MILSAWPIIPVILSVRSCYTLYISSIIVLCSRSGLSLLTQHFPLYPLLSLPFSIFIQSIYYNVIPSFAENVHYRLQFLVEHPSAGSSFSTSDQANFFSSSLSVPALFFLLPLFLTKLHFFVLSVHFTRSIFLHTHISNVSSRFCAFRRSFQVSVPNTPTLHAKHFTSLFLSSFSKGPQKMVLFLLKASFAIAILCFTS